MYGVIRDPVFDEQLLALVGTIERVDDRVAGLEYIVARDPFVFPLGGQMRVAQTRDVVAGLTVWAFFTMETWPNGDEKVVLKRLELAP